MSIDPAAAAAPAPKRARTPYRPPLLSLWARNDLADSVVAFLPGTNLSKLPVIAKSFRSAQPLVLFTAARRLKVLDRAQDAFLGVLREVTPERRLFRETWTEGLARWQMWQIAAQRGLRADIVGSPPCLRLRGSGGDHIGLFHQLPRSGERSLIVKHFRAQVTFPDGVSAASRYVLLCPDDSSEVIGGIFGTFRREDEDDFEEIDPADRVAVLTWLATERNEDGLTDNKVTELCTVTPGVCYEVTASFSGKVDDGNMIATVTVTPRGQPPSIVCCIRCLAKDLHVVQIYNFRDGEANIGEVEVEYEDVDESGFPA